MSRTIKILALPLRGWVYDGERDDFFDRIRACSPRGYYVINGYNDASDLAQRIQDTIDNDGENPAIELLEIWTHASPGKINGLTFNNTDTWSTELKAIRSWADEAAIYLSGCNTGLTGSSIARKLAEAMPFQPGQFEHRIRIYGSAGYLYGSHACRNPRSECVYIRRGEGIKKFFAFVWGLVRTQSVIGAGVAASTVDVEFKPYTGCRDASGADAYNEFRNWS